MMMPIMTKDHIKVPHIIPEFYSSYVGPEAIPCQSDEMCSSHQRDENEIGICLTIQQFPLYKGSVLIALFTTEIVNDYGVKLKAEF